MRLQKLPKIRIRTTHFCPPSRQAHFNFPSSLTAFYAMTAKIVKQMHREKIKRILGGIWGSWYKIPYLLVGVQTHKQPPPNPNSQSQFSYSILARFSSLADRQAYLSWSDNLEHSQVDQTVLCPLWPISFNIHHLSVPNLTRKSTDSWLLSLGFEEVEFRLVFLFFSASRVVIIQKLLLQRLGYEISLVMGQPQVWLQSSSSRDGYGLDLPGNYHLQPAKASS